MVFSLPGIFNISVTKGHMYGENMRHSCFGSSLFQFFYFIYKSQSKRDKFIFKIVLLSGLLSK